MWKDKLKSETFVYIIYAIFIACLFLFVRGYQFNTDDQAEHLPQVYQLMDHSLYQHDYFVTEYHKTYSLRSFYVWFVYGLSFIAPVSVICFVLTLLCISLSSYSFIRITTFYTKDKLTPFMAPLFIYFVFYKFTIGGNTITDSSLICSTIALSLAVFGLLQFHKKKYYLMAMIFGIATLFQVMDAAQPFFLVALFMIVTFRRIGIKTVLNTLLIYLLFAGAMLVPMIYHQFFIHYDYDQNKYADIIFFFRNPNHFVPSSFPSEDYICFIVLLLIGLGQLLEKVKSPFRWYVFFEGNVIIIGCIIYIICFEAGNMFWIAKTQWFKSTMWVCAFDSIFIAIGLKQRLLMNLDSDKMIRIARKISLIGIPVLLFVILNSAMIPVPKLQGRYMVGNYKKSDLTLMHEWIASNTDKDATILTAPSDFSFACEAKRSMPIGWKAIIHEPFFMFPWYKKFGDIYSTRLINVKDGNALSVANSSYNTVLYMPENTPVKIDYRLDDISKCHFAEALGKEIHRQGNYVLTEFKTHEGQ